MREIKFRAWDRQLHYMRNDFVINAENGNSEWRHVAALPKQLIIMQFTGLHDKNGKEIYEGDVVRRICKQWCCGKETYRMDGVIEWFVEGWIFKQDGENDYGWANQKNEEIEVIGNIYENTELVTP